MKNILEALKLSYYPDDYESILERPFGAVYILCEKQGTKFFISDTKVMGHGDLDRIYLRKEYSIQKPRLDPEVNVLGGGFIYYYGIGKGIVLTGKSVSYPSLRSTHPEAKKILEEMFHSKVKIEIEDSEE